MLPSGPRSEYLDIVRWQPRQPVHRSALTAKTDRREIRHSVKSASIFENLTGMPSALLIAPFPQGSVLRHPDVPTPLPGVTPIVLMPDLENRCYYPRAVQLKPESLSMEPVAVIQPRSALTSDHQPGVYKWNVERSYSRQLSRTAESRFVPNNRACFGFRFYQTT